jgi:hypothetical protein
MLTCKTVNLPIDALKIDCAAYQRTHDNAKSQKLIKDIAENFNPHALGIITVTKRADGWYVVDGWHRVEGLKLRKEKQVTCLVTDGLKMSGEATVYGIINGKRKHQTYSEMFKAKLASGDPEALDIKNIVERFGFHVTAGGSKNYIKSVKELEIIYRQLGRANFTRLFYLLRHTWDGEHLSLLKEMLLGMMLFIEKTGEKVVDTEFIRKMSKVALIDIVKDAKLYLLVSTDKYAYAKSILKHYNFRRGSQVPESIFYIEKVK